MERNEILGLLKKIKGCTFASLDAVTKPSAGVRQVVTNERVILFTNKAGSGYENMVKRRLAGLGKDPDSFVVRELPWGERVKDTPLIYHNGAFYLQCVLLASGEVELFIGTRRVDPSDVSWLKRDVGGNQGLPEGQRVVVHTYALESITAIRLLGEEVAASGPSRMLTTPVSERVNGNLFGR